MSNQSFAIKAACRALPALALAGLTLAACGSPTIRTAPTAPVTVNSNKPSNILTGQAALDGDYSTSAPGVARHITVGDLPAPYATPSVNNGPPMIHRPDGAMPEVPAGFAVTEFATNLDNPRKLVTAPNGDIFVVESGPGRVRVLRGSKSGGKPDVNEVFCTGLHQPFGLAFYPVGPNPKYVYVANTDSVVRFPYHNGDLKATGPSETVVNDISGGGHLPGGGHWTRDIVFSKDGKTMYVSVGSKENVMDNPNMIDVESRRARIFAYDPDGSHERVYATGIRNPVGIAINPTTGQLWCSVNERDGLGDNLVPDYITHVTPGGFYGWPWYYMGGHPDKRAIGTPTASAASVITPDILLQAHSASLNMLFYTAKQFPREYQGGIFAAEHGSWNRSRRTGYDVIFAPVKNGKAAGSYEDFMTGFVTSDGHVWGRPVGLTVDRSGSLLVSDDGSNTIWRITYTGK